MSAGHDRWALRLLDLTVYAIGTTLVVAVALVPPSLLAGAGLVGVKIGLFLVGVLAFGYATVLLWPSRSGGGTARFTDRGWGRGSGGGAIEGERGWQGDDQPPPGGSARGSDLSGSTRGSDPREETRFESLVGRVAPLAWYDIPPIERFHPGTKLYVASLLMLAVSYAMEAVFGVRA